MTSARLAILVVAGCAAPATKARARTLVLHHQLFFGQTESELVDEVKRGFRGNVVSAHDLQTL